MLRPPKNFVTTFRMNYLDRNFGLSLLLLLGSADVRLLCSDGERCWALPLRTALDLERGAHPGPALRSSPALTPVTHCLLKLHLKSHIKAMP